MTSPASDLAVPPCATALAMLAAALLVWLHTKLGRRAVLKLFTFLPAPDELPEALALQDEYRRAPKGAEGVAMHDGKVLLVCLEAIRSVCVDFERFPERGMPRNERVNPLSAHLFSLDGERWKLVRRAMTPAFLPDSIKSLIPLHEHTIRDLHNTIDAALGEAAHVDMDVKGLMERQGSWFVMDDTGRTLYDIECEALRRPVGNDILVHCTRAFGLSLWRRVRQQVLRLWPCLGARLPHRFLTARFFQDIVNKLRAAKDSSTPRPNLFEVMHAAETESATVQGCPAANVIRDVQSPQMFATFRAGFEAVAPTLTFALLELAHNQAVQDRLAAEVDAALRSVDMLGLAEAVASMEYLSWVVRETLRKYPANVTLRRRAAQRCRLRLDSACEVDQGACLLVPVFAIHHDPTFFPDPEGFIPERFQDSTPRGYMPFGYGRRQCVAHRFAVQQVKLGLVALLSRYSLQPCAGTPSLPLRFLAGRSIVLALAADECPLRLAPREARDAQAG